MQSKQDTMTRKSLVLLLVLFSTSIYSQQIVKPVGCFAGTNGTQSPVLAHSESRGVLLTEKWSDIEQSPGVYDFTALNNKINTVTSAGKKYSLAISAGAFGSPAWLIDSLNVDYHSFQYQNQTWRLPLWWDTVGMQELSDLITQIGNQYASDTNLSHVYVSQMTVNGIEGHLNGVNMTAFAADGFTNQRWITSAKNTAYEFADAFPDKPIVFEVHEINQDTILPATILNALTNDPSLCNRVGLGMWWISGKTTYQPDLIDFIANYQGDKYAQVIGRSDQLHRFEDSLYSSVFTQAKELNIRYIEPWPYEFRFNTHDSLLHDFNAWADTTFSAIDSSCVTLKSSDIRMAKTVQTTIYPNPTSGYVNLQTEKEYKRLNITLYNLLGERVINRTNSTTIDLRPLPAGTYILTVEMDDLSETHKLLKVE